MTTSIAWPILEVVEAAAAFCDRECQEFRQHECGILYQISIMMGYTFQAEHCPIIPAMMKASRATTNGSSHRPIPSISQPVPGDHFGLDSTLPRPESAPVDAIGADDGGNNCTPLHACPHYQTRFLTAPGLEKHLPTHDLTTDGPLVRAAKIPKLDTVTAMLHKPASVIVAPSKSYQCPICLEQIGRKALARHIVLISQPFSPFNQVGIWYPAN